MARPKRAKIAQSISGTSSTRVANPTTSFVNDQQPDPFHTSSNHTTTNSDDSDGLVMTKRTGVSQNHNATHEATMSGALAPEEKMGTRRKPPNGRKRALFSKIVIDAGHSKAIEALKARMDADLAAVRAGQVQVPSSIPAGISPSEKQLVDKAKIVHKNNNGQLDLAAEPKASGLSEARISLLKASNVKTRMRKPSLLQLVQAQANQGNGDEDDDLDDFLPDDESTPFLKTKSIKIQRDAPSSPLTDKQTSSSRKRKLSITSVQVPMTQPVPLQATSPASLSPSPEPVLEVDLFSLPSDNDLPEPSLPLPRPARIESPKVWSDTLAPPQSSSPTPPLRTKPTKISSKPRARKKLSSGPAPRSSPPALTPAKPVSRPLKPLSTATLQNLLPRRRARPNLREPSAFDVPESSDAEIDTSGLAEDEDELSVHAKPRGRPRKHQIGLGNKATLSAKAKGKPTTAIVAAATSAKFKERGKEKTPGGQKTYTRKKPTRLEDDDEDDHDLDTQNENEEHPARGTSHTDNRRPSKELQRLAAMFREVDEWALEIEDVTASSENLKDAR